MALEEYKLDMEQCCRCSCCKFIPLLMIDGYEYVSICPSVERYKFHAYSGGGKLNIGAALLEGTITYSEFLQHVVYNCQLCGGCAVSCNFGMDMYVLEPIIELRIRLASEGFVPFRLKEVLEIFRTHGTIVKDMPAKGVWAHDLRVKDAFEDQAKIYFHVGCLMNSHVPFQDLARKAVMLLKEGGLDVGIGYENELCCGSKIYQMGFKEDFVAKAREYTERLRKAKVETVVTACADCYWALKVLYSRYGLNGAWNVYHISEVLEKLLVEGRIRTNKLTDMVVTYHDPCRLGRLGEPWIHWEGKKIPGPRFVFEPPRPYRRGMNGIYDPPRRVLSNIPGVRMEEMPRRREFSWCCGSGGAVDISNPDFALWTATQRIKEAESTGAEALVTACPWCQKLLNEAQKESKRIEVRNLIDIVTEAVF